MNHLLLYILLGIAFVAWTIATYFSGASMAARKGQSEVAKAFENGKEYGRKHPVRDEHGHFKKPE